MYEELIQALRYCDLVVNNTENTLQCGVCPYFERCSDLDNQAADALEAQTAQLAAKDAEIERLNGRLEADSQLKSGLLNANALCGVYKADLARVTAERDAAINEVCMKCKPSEIVEGLAFYACDGCRWRTPEKQDEEG